MVSRNNFSISQELLYKVRSSLVAMKLKQLPPRQLGETLYFIDLLKDQIQSVRAAGFGSKRIDELDRAMDYAEEACSNYRKYLEALFCYQLRKKGHLEE